MVGRCSKWGERQCETQVKGEAGSGQSLARRQQMNQKTWHGDGHETVRLPTEQGLD